MKKHCAIFSVIVCLLVLAAIFGTMYVYYSCVEGWFSQSSEVSGEYWCNAGSFGDLFGGLTCFFTGLSIAGLLINLFIQGRQLEESKNDSAFNKALAFKTFIIDNIQSDTSFMTSLQYPTTISSASASLMARKVSYGTSCKAGGIEQWWMLSYIVKN